MTPPLGAAVVLPDGRQGVVRASWSGYWHRDDQRSDHVDYVRVDRWRVYVEVTTDGCASCGHGSGVRHETLDADQVALVA